MYDAPYWILDIEIVNWYNMIENIYITYFSYNFLLESIQKLSVHIAK